MKKFRLGRDLTINWQLEPLEDITLILRDSRGNNTKLDYLIEDGSVVAKYEGREQKYYGTYSITAYLNYGKENQSVLDRKQAFILVGDTDNEDSILTLEHDEFTVGVQGDSAYIIWLKQGNEGTEADFIKDLCYKLTEEDRKEFTLPAINAYNETTEKVDNKLNEFTNKVDSKIEEMKNEVNETEKNLLNTINGAIIASFNLNIEEGKNNYNNY